MSGRASVIGKKGAGLTLVRRADRPRVVSLPPPNRYVRERTDSGNRKLTNCFSFSTGALQMKVIAVVRFRAGQVRRGTKCSIAGWGGGETGDFKCLTLVKLKPRPFKKPGLFLQKSSESPLLSVRGSLATALRYLYLEDFRDSGLVVLHYLDVVPFG